MQHTLAQPHAGLQLRRGRRTDLLQQLRGELVDAQRNRSGGLQDEVDRSETQRFQRLLGAVGRARRHHDDGARPFEHEPIEAFETAHLGHLHVEGYDVRAEGLDALQRFDAVARELHLEIGLVAEHSAEQLAHQCRVIDDEDLDHALSRSAF